MRLSNHVKKIYEKEAIKLGMENKDIKLIITDVEPCRCNNPMLEFLINTSISGPSIQRLGYETYAIRIPKKDTYKLGLFKRDCRHELYHLAAGHLERGKMNFFRDIILDEISAELYASFNINVDKLLKDLKNLF